MGACWSAFIGYISASYSFVFSYRDPPQRWQPPLSSKAVLLKGNNQNQTKGATGSASLQLPNHSALSKASGHGTCTLNPGSAKSAGNYLYTQAYKTTPTGKMAADTRQGHNPRKATHGHFCLVASSDLVANQTALMLQSSAPRSVSPHGGATARLYDHPPADSPIYDDPSVDMEVEGAHLQNSPSCQTPSLQKTKLLQPPGQTHTGSRHKRNPSASDYSPAGLECIKHMVNVDSKQALLSTMPALSPASPSSGPESLFPQAQREPVSLEKKQSWRLLEVGVLRAIEVHHSRQSSEVSQDYSTPPPPTGTYQDSGYSTGPSPSLRRKSRRRMGAATQGRPGSVGSTGELSALNERLMAEMREVVSRSSTMRETKASLDSDMLEGCSVQSSPSPLGLPSRFGVGARCSSREDIASSSRSLSRLGNHACVTLSTLEIPGRQKRTYEKVDTLEKSVNSQVNLSSPETPGPSSQVCLYYALLKW